MAFNEEDHPRDERGRFAVVQRDSSGRPRLGHLTYKGEDSDERGIHAARYLAELTGEDEDDTRDFVKAATHYTEDGHAELNERARAGTLEGSSVEHIANDLDNFLRISPKFTEGVPVYREAALKADTVEKLRTGELKTISDKGYLSSSSDMEKAVSAGNPPDGHDRVLIKVNSHFSGVSIAGVSSNSKEKEVLFPRGAKFRVDSVTDIADGVRLEVTEVLQK